MMRSKCRYPHNSTSASRVRRRSRRCTAITTGRNIISTRSLNRSDTSTGRRSRDRFVGLPIRRSSRCTRRPVSQQTGYARSRTTFDQACERELAAAPLSAPALGDMLRHALGLSAWKRFGSSRWSLRVNPSSGNLHPTEAYVICGALPGLVDQPAVYHYAADRHAIELRCVFDEGVWREAFGGRQDRLLVALTSIHWREAWKYGERAFRYCQHDLGSRDSGRVDRRRAHRVACRLCCRRGHTARSRR